MSDAIDDATEVYGDAAACSWQRIKTAPTSREARVDLWAVNRKTGESWRVTECYRSYDGTWLNSRGHWFTGRRYFCKAEQDEVYDRACADEQSVVVTHWMYPPKPPIHSGESGT